MESEIRPGRFQVLPVVIKNLIIINALVWLAQITVGKDLLSIEDLFALHHFSSVHYHFWQFITYMFLHSSDSFFHILFNMLFLYWFGLLVHQYLGSRKLTNLYILGGLFGAAFYLLIYNLAPYFSGSVDNSLMLGASAGVYAVVGGAATLAPQTTFVLLLLGPVKIVYIAAFYVILSFANSIGANAGGEIAHLGGALLGYLYITQLRKGRDLGIPVQKVGIFFEDLFSRKSNVKRYSKRSKI